MATATKRNARKKTVGRPSGSPNKYKFNLTSAIEEIIKRKGRFIHQREIAEALLKKAGKVEDPIAFARKTSVLLYTQKGKRLAQYATSSSTRDKYYGLPEWMAKNRKPVSGKEPKIA